MNMQSAHIDVLADIVSNNADGLSARQRDFAMSLVRQWNGKRRLSDKQTDWLMRLAEQALSEGEPAAAKPEPERERPMTQVNVSGIIALFERAAEALKYPKIRLRTIDGQPVVLSVAGPRSQAPGSINITDGRPYGENIWFGRIERDGRWVHSRKVTGSIVEIVVALSVDPEAVAAEYGRITGHCCFCARALDDPRSVSVGYGPICAGHYGLPWGTEARESAQDCDSASRGT